MCKALKKQEVTVAAVLSKTGVSSVTSGTLGKHVQSDVDGDVRLFHRGGSATVNE